MGRLSIHEAHQHHSALTLQEYKRLPPARLSSSSFSPLPSHPAPVSPLRLARRHPPATRPSLRPAHHRHPGVPCSSSSLLLASTPSDFLLLDAPTPRLPPPWRHLLLVARQILSYSHQIRPPQATTVFTNEFPRSFFHLRGVQDAYGGLKRMLHGRPRRHICRTRGIPDA
jgi:hypothetical protein